MTSERRTKVLVVDDSAIVRKVLSDILSRQPDLEVVGTAPDPYVARDKIVSLKPDVLTLDIEMPRMDGLTFLDRLMKAHPMPVIVISSLAQNSTKAALEAMHRGAVDVLAKPGGPYSVGDLRDDLPRRIRAAAMARMRSAAMKVEAAQPAAVDSHTNGKLRRQLIAIGASTGGTLAIEHVLRAMPASVPPIVITQHIPPGFSAAFAERLNHVCAMEVREARDGDRLREGCALIAPGNYHMVIEKNGGGGWRVCLDNGPKVCYQRPSVDVMFRSVATHAGQQATGVLMTGMGSDGAEGMAEVRRMGGKTIAQSEETCVVFGMPKEAIRLGGVERVMGLGEIGQALVREMRAS